MAGWPGPNWAVSLITATSQASFSRWPRETLPGSAADLFFAFDQELELHRQPAGRLSQASVLLTCVSIWPLSSVAPRA